MCVWCSRGKRARVSLTYRWVSRYPEAHGQCGHRTVGGCCWGSSLGKLFKRDKFSWHAFDHLLATWVMTLHVEKCCVDGQQGQVRRSLPGGQDTSEPLPQAWLPLLEGTSLFLSVWAGGRTLPLQSTSPIRRTHSAFLNWDSPRELNVNQKGSERLSSDFPRSRTEQSWRHSRRVKSSHQQIAYGIRP